MSLVEYLSAITARLDAATPGPWVEYTDLDYTPPSSTGWISGVNDYKGCGSHMAEWKPGCLALTLAAPTDLRRLVEIAQCLSEAMVRICDPGDDCGDNHGWADVGRYARKQARAALERAQRIAGEV